jgi:hypothetical protein
MPIAFYARKYANSITMRIYLAQMVKIDKRK